MKHFFLIISWLVSLQPLNSQVNYFVSPGGMDTQVAGTSPSNPFQSIHYALNFLSAGDTLNIMEGVYQNSTFGDGNFFKPQSDCAIYLNDLNGNDSMHIVIRNFEYDYVTLKGDGLAIVHIKNCSYIDLYGFEVYGEVENIPLDTALQYQFLYMDENEILQYRLPPHTPSHIVEDTILPLLSPQISRPTYFNTIGIAVVNCHHILVEKNYVHHMPGEGIRGVNSDYLRILKNEVHNCSRRSSTGVHGISLYTMVSIDTVQGVKVEMSQNVVHDNYNEVYSWSSLKTFITPHFDEGKGITVQRCTASRLWKYGRILIENNLTYRNGFSGIQINEGERVDIINNTCYRNHVGTELFGDGSQHGISVQTADDINIWNNIVTADKPLDGKAVGISNNSINVVIDRNLIFGHLNNVAQNIAQNTITADPEFMEPSIRNFRLKPTSPAINVSGVTHAPAIDLYDYVRDQNPDLGAIEYRTSCSTLVTNPENSGPSSLRDVIDCAQDGDTILFSNDLLSIELKSPLYVTKNLFLIGNINNGQNTIINQFYANGVNNPVIVVDYNKYFTVSNVHTKGIDNISLSPNWISHGVLIMKESIINSNSN